MAQNKTIYTKENVFDFLDNLENDQKKTDSLRLIELMKNITNEEPKMFGSSIVGFGEYHYKYNSGHEGNAPLLGFSPRKNAFSLYVFTGLDEHHDLLQNLGKFTMGKACIYVKKLSDINEEELKKMMQETVKYLSDNYERIS